ncbi:uncharacterized protein TNCV_4278981 [Trichonephila clavipes]|nr:uncharacterized protein TNCV_4278981 [Trichonephila clavipes]
MRTTGDGSMQLQAMVKSCGNGHLNFTVHQQELLALTYREKALVNDVEKNINCSISSCRTKKRCQLLGTWQRASFYHSSQLRPLRSYESSSTNPASVSLW